MKLYKSSRIEKGTVNKNFSTFQLTENSIKSLTESHIYITDRAERELLADDVFALLDAAYDDIGGFKSFKDITRFISDSYLWYITYEGEKPENLEDFDVDKVYAVSVFRKKNGLKMVGMACNTFPNIRRKSSEFATLRNNARAALIEHIKFVGKKGWAEVSGKLESYFARALPCKYIIIPEILIDNKVLSNVDIDLDGLHYYRAIRKGEEKIQKIAYGTIKI